MRNIFRSTLLVCLAFAFPDMAFARLSFSQMFSFSWGGGSKSCSRVAAPRAPGGLRLAAKSSSDVHFSWNASSSPGVTAYLIQRDGVQIASVAASVLDYDDQGLSPSTAYSYTVQAQGSCQKISAKSAALNVTTDAAVTSTPPPPSPTPTPTPTPPAAPSALSAAAASSSQINLSWTNNDAAQLGVDVERSADGASFNQIAQLGASTASYSDNGLSASTKYYYRVRAYNDAGSSSYSNIASASTAAAAVSSSGPVVPRGPVSGPSYTSTYSISGQSNMVIEGANFSNTSGDCLQISNSSNITIKNSSFIHCHGVGINVDNSTNIVVEDNYFEDINHGVFALNSTGLTVDYNNFKNLVIYNDDSPHFVIFDNVVGGVNDISYNRGINIQGQSHPEDLINMYKSSGTAQNPIMIQGNCFQGGGPSDSGGGIMAGDSGGSYIMVQNNRLVSPGQYGIAVSNGSHNQVLNNQIYQEQEAWTNIGLYCSKGDSNTFTGNRVDYTNSSGQKNSWWNGSCSNTVQSGNDFSVQLSTLSCSLY